ncbi:MAG: DUF454 domain-containing protein [Caldiserica bacterium]|nr:DUF454 domain-containing protein [Caldisericota bacterium]
MTLKAILIAAGYLFLGLGIIGAFVPVLPTTPFVLLAAACFMKSSSRLHTWLSGHRIFGSIILNYTKNKSSEKKTKIIAICVLWFSIGISATLLSESIWIKLFLLVVAVAVTVHLLLLKTASPKEISKTTP